jgi:hypothetical protein
MGIIKAAGLMLPICLYIFVVLFFSGCASTDAYQSYVATHTISSAGYYEAAKQPLVDISLPSPDPLNPYHIVLNREVKPMAPEQIKDSEWTGPINGLISAAGMVGGIWAAGDAMGNIMENAGHNTTTNTETTTIDNEGDGTVSYTGDTTTTTETTTVSTDMSEVEN